MIALAASIAVGVIANRIALAAWGASYLPTELENFLFFWFPNQLSVFALGGVVYFLLLRSQQPDCKWSPVIRGNSTAIALGSVAAFGTLPFLPTGRYLGAYPYLPAGQAASVALAVFLVALSVNRGALVNRYAAAMGKVSFSAYLIHFAVLRFLGAFPSVFHTHAAGWRAIAAFAAGWLFAAPVTYVLSSATYHGIELPMISVGKNLILRRKAVLRHGA